MKNKIYMPDPPIYADIQYWEGYGFVCPNHATTNGSLSVLLNTLKEVDRQRVKEWAETIVKD